MDVYLKNHFGGVPVPYTHILSNQTSLRFGSQGNLGPTMSAGIPLKIQRDAPNVLFR